MADSRLGESALSLPEILASVLEHLFGDETTLCAASLVNRMWTHYATPLLWRWVTSDDLERLHVTRRAYFAAMVERLQLRLSSARYGEGSDDDDGSENAIDDKSVMHHDFPRLRELRIRVSRYYRSACDRAITRFLRQRCSRTRLSGLTMTNWGASQRRPLPCAISAELFMHLAQRRGLTSLRILGDLELTQDVVQNASLSVLTAAATVAPREDYSTAAELGFFAAIERLELTIAPSAIAALTRLLPVSLTRLRLRLTRADHVGRNGMRQLPLVQLKDGLLAAAAAAAVPPWPAALHPVPNLRELVVQYKEGWASAADIDAVRCLPGLRVLEIGWWQSGNNSAFCSYCSRFDDDTHVGAPHFGDEDLDRLLSGLPLLRRLSMTLRSRMAADALLLARRKCPSLEHLELRGSRPLPAFPPPDMKSGPLGEPCLCIMHS
jgi:hypothetical protein